MTLYNGFHPGVLQYIITCTCVSVFHLHLFSEVSQTHLRDGLFDSWGGGGVRKSIWRIIRYN